MMSLLINSYGRRLPQYFSRAFHAYSSPIPTDHNSSDVAKYLVINDDDLAKLDPFNQVFDPINETLLFHAIGEAALMIRRPMIEIAETIEKSKPFIRKNNLRMLLYGKEPGVGKTFVMFNAIHRAYYDDWWIVHFPSVKRFLTEAKEVVTNDKRPDLYDTPIEAALWLEHFASQNHRKLNQTGDKYKTSIDYVWNDRESTPIGSPLRDLVQFGIQRAKYACDCVAAVLSEVQGLSSQDRSSPTLIALDGINALFSEDQVTWIRNSARTRLLSSQLSMVHQMVRLLKPELANSVTLCSVGVCDAVLPKKLGRIERRSEHRRSMRPTRYDHIYDYDGPSDPMNLLGLRGFDQLTPFIPIEVGKLTEHEFDNWLEYLKSKNWITHPAGSTTNAKNQIRFLTSMNAREMSRVSRII